eukprot:1160596-Pelagomonas_calceolata.AAC.4
MFCADTTLLPPPGHHIPFCCSKSCLRKQAQLGHPFIPSPRPHLLTVWAVFHGPGFAEWDV